MRTDSIPAGAMCLLLTLAAAPAHAQVFSSEFFSDPVSEGWELAAQVCNPALWTQGGWYHQQLDLGGCEPPGGGGADVYRRSLEPFNGTTPFFAEFRVETDGDRSEIPGGAPALLAIGCSCPVIYHITVSRDLVQFFRAADLPVWFIEIEPGVPHTFRIELYPDRYGFYIDGYVIDEGIPEGPFPAYDSRISWRGRSWYLPCHNAWDYLRYGRTPVDGSGDFDSDGALTQHDFYFFHECLNNVRPGINGGPGNDAGPGCRFADFNADADTDLADFADFQNAFGRTK
jgi:hypothetical protein